MMSGKNQSYKTKKEQRKKAIELYTTDDTLSRAEIARRVGVTDSTIKVWLDEYDLEQEMKGVPK